MEVIDQVQVSLNVEQVLRYLHLDRNGDHAGDVQGMIDAVCAVARPKAAYDVKYIDSREKDSVTIGGISFKSRIFRVNLDKVERVFPYVATCGWEVEKIDTPPDDIMAKFVLDGIKQIVLEQALQQLQQTIETKYGVRKMSAMNPGSLEDWQLSEQKKLFSLLGDVEKLIGVKLTENCLMMPIKSVSGVFFPTEVSFENCQLCPRERCPGRRAPYDECLMQSYFAGKTARPS